MINSHPSMYSTADFAKTKRLPQGRNHLGCVLFAVLAAAVLLPAQAAAQSLSVGSASGLPGAAVDLTVNFTAGSTGVSTVQFDLTFPSTLAYVSTTTGSAATAAGKSASGSAIAGGVRVLIFGLNQNAIGTGPVAIVRLNIQAGAPAGTITVSIGNIAASDPLAAPVAVGGSNGSVTVNAPADTTPPVISGVTSSGITQTGATISWTTNEASNTQVDYGTTTSYGSSTTLNSAMVTSHSQSLAGLQAATTYHYRVRSRDAAGNLAVSGDYTFTTAESSDTTPPVISGVTASNITASSATITWITNEAADSQVEYGTSVAYGSSTALVAAAVTSHSQVLAGLTGNTLYHYRVRSRDAGGNLSVSADYTFTTGDSSDMVPPVISSVSVTQLTESSAVIAWTTDEPADSKVDYGTSESYSSSTPLSAVLVKSHTQMLTGLSPKTLYHFRVKSKDAAGNLTESADFTFTTLEDSGSGNVQKTLFYPRPITSVTGEPNQDGEEYVGVAVANLDHVPATIRFTACDAAGAKITGENITNPVTRTLNPGQQLPVLDTELFGPGLAGHNCGWIKVESSVRNLAGFFMIFDSGLHVLDGATIDSSPASSFVFTEVEPEGFTRLDITNPNADAAALTFELVQADGVVRAAEQKTIKENGSLTLRVYQDLFVGAAAEGSDHIRVTSNVPVVAFQLMGKEGRYIHALNAADAMRGGTTLYSPQYVVGGPWRSALSIVNLESTPGSLTVRFIPENPLDIGSTKILPIAGRGKIYIDDPAFFQSLFVSPAGEITQGFVEIVSDGVRLAGDVVFGDMGRENFSSALPMVTALDSALMFSHVASNDMYFTGISILNPHGTNALATLDLYGADGSLEATAQVLIRGRERVSKVLTEYFPSLIGVDKTSGYIKITTDKPVASYALFGTTRLNVLSAIPAQVVR